MGREGTFEWAIAQIPELENGIAAEFITEGNSSMSVSAAEKGMLGSRHSALHLKTNRGQMPALLKLPVGESTLDAQRVETRCSPPCDR